MRIRLNARRVVPEGTQLRASFLVCKLNQSPWDDDAFVSQLFEDESDDRFPYTRSSTDPSPISNSIQIVESPMELVFEYIGKPLSPTPPPSTEQPQEEEKQPVEVPVGANSPPPDFIDLSSSPRRACAQPSNENNHMSSQSRPKRTIYRSMKYLCPPPIPKRSSAPPPPPPPSHVPASSSKKRGRPQKHTYETRGKTTSATTSAVKNNSSSDYYYYTGFGPNRGKKRGEVVPTNNDDCRTSRKGKAKSPALIEDDVVIHMSTKNNEDVSMVNHVDPKEVIYISSDDDDDDDDNDNGDGLVRNRPRKAIKARSLNSL